MIAASKLDRADYADLLHALLNRVVNKLEIDSVQDDNGRWYPILPNGFEHGLYVECVNALAKADGDYNVPQCACGSLWVCERVFDTPPVYHCERCGAEWPTPNNDLPEENRAKETR